MLILTLDKKKNKELMKIYINANRILFLNCILNMALNALKTGFEIDIPEQLG